MSMLHTYTVPENLDAVALGKYLLGIVDAYCDMLMEDYDSHRGDSLTETDFEMIIDLIDGRLSVMFGVVDKLVGLEHSPETLKAWRIPFVDGDRQFGTTSLTEILIFLSGEFLKDTLTDLPTLDRVINKMHNNLAEEEVSA